MIWEPLNCGSFVDKIYLRLFENVLEISLKIVLVDFMFLKNYKVVSSFTGIVMACAALGPALGFVFGGQMLNIYVDFDSLSE